MREITIGPPLGESLCQLDGQAILCDANGRALGFFSPIRNLPSVDELQLEPPLSIADTELLRKEQTGKPLGEILARLGVQ
jgi:hypothetical protein